ncbi:retrovirus-related pol polyprotein from transposon TNT 1-94 [Tanacetum coccineum]|uniref:Retrovirus-related pol polyprotein from transposon TNT 1-94 n=1 Tax=Tanacetum coccineum TaxID=301880 RepID=A0ABQ5FE38_9ASTR
MVAIGSSPMLALAAVPVAEGSSETTIEGYIENYKNVSQDIRDQLNAEAEAVKIILIGIDNDIYSTVDACPNAGEMCKAIERLKQGESIKMMNELVRNQCDVTNHQVNVQFLLQLQPEWQRFVTLVKQSQELQTVSYHKLYDILKQHHTEVNEIRAERIAQPTMVAEDDEMSKDKEIDKLMDLISLSFKKIYKPTNNNLRTSSNTSKANQDNTPRINNLINTSIANQDKFSKDTEALLGRQFEMQNKPDWKDDTIRECEWPLNMKVMLWPQKIRSSELKTMNKQERKQHKASCKTKLVNSVTKPLHTLHMDLFGPTSVSSLNHKWYCLVVTDDFSRFTWTFFLKSKDETSSILRNFITEIENLKDLKVKIIRCDNGGEFRNKEMANFCLRTLIEAARTMLADAKLPVTFWAEAVNTACYVQNRVLVNKSQHKTPYELFNGRSPAIGFLRPFGILPNSKAFRVFNKRTKKIDENLHVDFLENQPIEKGTGPNWLFDIDSLTKLMNYVPVVVAEQFFYNISGQKKMPEGNYDNWNVSESSGNTNPTAITKDPTAEQVEPVLSSTVETEVPTVSTPIPTECLLKDFFGDTPDSVSSDKVEADLSNMETDIQISPTPTLRIHKVHPKNQIIGPYCLFSCFLSQEEPKKLFDALKDPSWVEAMQEELLQFKIQNVWVLVDCPNGVRPIGTKWVLKNKRDERGIVIRNKARLVAQGHHTEEGINYEEVFAPVARIEAIRLFLAYASYMGFTVYQMDVKSAFLYGTIDEEVYVMQPPGFQDSQFPDKVYKVVKAMYGLHQAPRAWYGTLSKYLLDNGFQRGTIDQTLFIRKHKGEFLLVQVYVDDIIFGSSNPKLCREFEALMHDKFKMSAMGELNFFLGLQVLQKKDGIFLSQDKYVVDILKKFGYTDIRSMIGSLMYLTASRPDIMFAVCACARHQVTPKEYDNVADLLTKAFDVGRFQYLVDEHVMMRVEFKIDSKTVEFKIDRTSGNIARTIERSSRRFIETRGNPSKFPPTNNQLRTSSNSKTHATVHDGQIVTEPIQRKAPAKEKGDVLDAEAEAFLADVECTAPYDQPQALTTTNMFQANHEDAYDSDVDEGPNAAVAFMANLSSTGATNNTVNEVHSNDNQIFDNVDYQIQEMHQEEHLDSDAETEIDDNTIPYHQYLLDTEAQNVPTEVSADTSDKVSMIAILTDLQTQLDGHAKVNQEKCLEVETLKNELFLTASREIYRQIP